MKRIVLAAVFMVGFSGGLPDLDHAETVHAQEGFIAVVDAVSDGAAGDVQATTDVSPNSSLTIEVEVRGVASGLNGYSVQLSWSPAASLTLDRDNIVDSTGFTQIVKSVGEGSATVSSTNLDDPTCIDPSVAPLAEGAADAVLFKATFENAGPDPGPIAISFDAAAIPPFGAEVAVCDDQASIITADAVETGEVVVGSGAAATPTNTVPAGPPTATPTPCAGICTPEPMLPVGGEDDTPTTGSAGSGTTVPGASRTGTPASGTPRPQGFNAATAQAAGEEEDSGGDDSGSGPWLWLAIGAAALIVVASGAGYYWWRRMR